MFLYNRKIVFSVAKNSIPRSYAEEFATADALHGPDVAIPIEHVRTGRTRKNGAGTSRTRET